MKCSGSGGLTWSFVACFLLVWTGAGNATTATPTATSTPTRTPTPQVSTVHGQVLTTGVDGLLGAAFVPVEVRFCYGSLAACEQEGLLWGQTTTDPTGYFQLPWQFNYSLFLFGTAEVGGTRLRNFVPKEWDTEIILDPTTEAAVRILSDAGLEHYDADGAAAVVAAVGVANAATDFSGLSLDAAVTLAETVALGDPGVRRALIENIVQPTPTPSPLTPSPTRRSATPTEAPTERVTATPRPCLGDCGGNGSVTIDELVLAINIALEVRPLADCPAYPSIPTVSDLVRAVNNALGGCAPAVPLPDLVPTGWGDLGPGKCPARPGATFVVCVVNAGDSSAGPFVVSVDDSEAHDVVFDGLEAGEEQCRATDWPWYLMTLVVDSTDAVEESREDNNEVAYLIPTRTVWTPPPTCSAVPTSTPTPTRTPTGTSCVAEWAWLSRELPQVATAGVPFTVHYRWNGGSAEIRRIEEALPPNWQVVSPPWTEHSGNTYLWDIHLPYDSVPWSIEVLPPAGTPTGDYYVHGQTTSYHRCNGEVSRGIDGDTRVHISA
jgi:hypothetical protein